jgi:hypothetical protein
VGACRWWTEKVLAGRSRKGSALTFVHFEGILLTLSKSFGHVATDWAEPVSAGKSQSKITLRILCATPPNLSLNLMVVSTFRLAERTLMRNDRPLSKPEGFRFFASATLM